MEPLWKIRLFDGPVAEDLSGRALHRFRSQRVGALLAYLALRLGRPVPREALCEALWPGEERAVAANRLRVALASLRKQLEPAGVAFGAVLDVSTPGRVILRKETVWCDAAALEQALRVGDRALAGSLAAGPLMPGYYDDWIVAEQARFEVLRDGLEGAAPPEDVAADWSASASTAVAWRLPLYLTRFWGRDAERAAVDAAVADSRLVTLVGPGGVGKTRLAVECARRQEAPVVFVALAGLADVGRLPETVLAALGGAARPAGDATEALIDALRRLPPLVLLLDNAEPWVEPVAQLALQLLEAAPSVRLLVTSRQRLGVAGERVLAVGALEFPPVSARPEQLLEFPAVALFQDRAASVRPDFAVTARNAESVVRLCRQLEGVPLALEVAAARVAVRTPAQLVESLAEQLLDLTSFQHGVPERHRSLRAALGSSVELLTPDERRFFGALWVFQGGWDTEAAAAVGEREDAEALLEGLVERSLVTVREDPESGLVRYSFLESLRQFARESVDPALHDAVRRRHARHYIDRLIAYAQAPAAAFVRLEGERDNVRAALEFGEGDRDVRFWVGALGWLELALRIGEHRAALSWWERIAPERGAVDAPLRLRLDRAVSSLLCDVGRFDEVAARAEAAEAEARALSDPVEAARQRCLRGYVHNSQGRNEVAVALLSEVLAEARTLGDPGLLRQATMLTSRALTGLALGMPVGSPERLARLRESEALNQELLDAMATDSSDRGWSLLNLSLLQLFQGDSERGYHSLKIAQRRVLAERAMALLLYSFLYEAQFETDHGEPGRAAMLTGAFRELQARMGYSLGLSEEQAVAIESVLRARLGPTFESYRSQGRQTPLRELVQFHRGEPGGLRVPTPAVTPS